MLSECKGDFEDSEMSHKRNKLLQSAGLFTDIDVILDSTGDLEIPPTPHPHTFPMKMPISQLSSVE
jgi:hypothetical protein